MHKETESSKKRSSKWKKRIIFGLLIFLAITIIVGILTVHTSNFRTFMLSKLDQSLRKDFNFSISAKSLDLNLFRLSASFEDLKITSLAPENSILQSFNAQKLTVNLSAMTLLGKKVHIQKLYITDPEVRLSMTKRVQASTKKVRPANNIPFSFRIDDFRLNNGKIDYQDWDYPITAFINDIAIDIHFQEDDSSHQGILTTQAGEFKIFESRFSLGKFLAELTFDDDSIQITRFLCETEPFIVDASGHIQDYQENPQYELAIQGSLRMDSLNKIPEIGHDFGGRLSVTTSITGTGSDLTFDGHVQAKDVLAADILLKNLEGDFEGDRTRIVLSNFMVEDSDGNLGGKLSLSIDEKERSTAEFRWTSLGLSALRHWMPKFAPLLSSRTSGYIIANWKKPTFDSLDAKGEIQFKSFPHTLPSSENDVDLEGNISFHAKNGIFTVLPSSVSFHQTELAISGNLDSAKQFKLKYQLRSKDLQDAERLIVHLRSHGLIPASTGLKPIQLDGQLLLTGEASGSIEQPRATLAITGRDFAYNTHTFGKLNAELKYADAKIDIVTLSMGTELGRMTVEGYVLIDPFEKSLIPSAELLLRASNTDIAPLTSITQEKYPVLGLFSGEVALSGKLTDPSVRFSGIFNDLIVNHEDFNSLTIRGEYLNQNLILDKLSIAKRGSVLEGSLGFDLKTQTFSVDFEGHTIDLSAFRSINHEEETLSGLVKFQLKGNGTVENPVFSLQLSTENLGAQRVWMGILGVKAVSDGRVVDICMETPLGQTSVVAKLILEEPYLIQGQLKTESIDIWHTIRSGIEPLPSPIASQISATADFVIPLRDWMNAKVFLSLEKGSFRYKDLTFQALKPILLKIENRELIIENFSIQGPQTEFTLSGSLPLTEKQSNNIHIK
ncbi:hypothetical protein ACFLRM_05675, partial [Acidobacteriota bacterium]